MRCPITGPTPVIFCNSSRSAVLIFILAVTSGVGVGVCDGVGVGVDDGSGVGVGDGDGLIDGAGVGDTVELLPPPPVALLERITFGVGVGVGVLLITATGVFD